MRAECQHAEAKASYLRRLIQGRLDIVASELRHREGGGQPSNVARLVRELPQVLGDKVHAPGPGRLPANLVPPDDDHLTAELDTAVDAATLGSMAQLDDQRLASLVELLTAMEVEVSAHRKALFNLIDALQAEMAERYCDGRADPRSLLG